MTLSSKSLEFWDARRVVLKGGLLLLPFLILQFLELFVLPIDFFTFRVWEAALAEPYRYPGAYYPNLYVRKRNEYGDQYRSGDSAKVQAKEVEWFIDAYGFRNRPEIERQEKYNVVIIGDSNIVGSFLDQKDTISEALQTRSGVVPYSYSIGHDKIGLFFSDPRMREKSTKLLVVETKVVNWITNDSAPVNFRTMPDGALEIVDRSQQFATDFYSPVRNHFVEKIHSQLTKQAMFHTVKAVGAFDFSVRVRSKNEAFFNSLVAKSTDNEFVFRPNNWMVEGGVLKPLLDHSQPALAYRSAGSMSYWHTEKFVSTAADGKIKIRFDAKNSISPSRHKAYIFEDGSYRSIGEIVAERDWKTFEVPITTNPGSLLEFQIDQLDAWQWLSIRDVQIIGGGPLPLVKNNPVSIPMAAWTGSGAACVEVATAADDCRQWIVARKKGFVQTPVLPPAGEGGLLVRFEARTDQPATVFTPVYLFEGDKYRAVAQYAFAADWREYSLLLKPGGDAPLKVQVDYPDSVGTLAIRNFLATPVELIGATRSNNVGR